MKSYGIAPVRVMVSTADPPAHISVVPLMVAVGTGKKDTVAFPMPVLVQQIGVGHTDDGVRCRLFYIECIRAGKNIIDSQAGSRR